jgi:UDP-N-acetylglucosamine/UDP-N-acetylgalactosamine diphosphorylase
VTDRSLFALQAQKLRGRIRRHGRGIPWLVMTSPATDASTRRLFGEAGYFGLAPEEVWFFPQALAPCLDLEGRLALARAGVIAEAPDGHGGALPALCRAGLVDRLRDRGIRQLVSYQVDNPLAPVVDPLFIGLHVLEGAEMSCKVVAKVGPDENAGTVGLLGGRVRVVEYTEVTEPIREAREPDGGLRYWAASIGMHVLDLGLIERVGAAQERWLPFHLSPKRIPGAGQEAPLESAVPNGYKLERFVFDALGAAGSAALLEVRRDEEYAPIKRPSGAQSPQTARRALVSCTRRWLEAAGIEGLTPESWIEVDHARIDSECDARRAGFRHVSEASGWILLGGGEAT